MLCYIARTLNFKKEKFMFKKIILAALVVTSAVFAQVNVGGRAAFSFGTFAGDSDMDVWGAGFNVGANVKVPVNPVLSLVSGLEIDYRRVSDEYDSGNYTVKKILSFTYIDVPVLLHINASPTFFFDAGLTLGFNVSANNIREANGNSRSNDISDEVKTFEAGLVGGFGFVIIPNLDLNIRAAYGLSNIVKEGGTSLKNLRFQAGVTYWFI